MSEQRIIVTGTPIDGFTYIGPFDSFESAEAYADHIGVMGDWWITDLQSPGTPEPLPLHYPGAAIPIPPVDTLSEGINWLHCNVQELEQRGVELPMGDYTDVYRILEDAREVLSSDDKPTEQFYRAYGAPSTWEPTHYSRKDGSGAVMVIGNKFNRTITLVNENGDQWTDPIDEWEPA